MRPTFRQQRNMRPQGIYSLGTRRVSSERGLET